MGDMRLMEHCIYCGADVFFTEDSSVVSCLSCGKRIILTEFQSEQIRIRKALREKDQIQQELAAARMEKETAQERLNGAISSLIGIRGSQESEQKQIEQILTTLQADQQTQNALLELTAGLKRGQESEIDILQSLVMTVMEGRAGINEKLGTVQEITQKILGAQGDIMATLRMQTDIVSLLQKQQISLDKQQRIINGFYHWSQAIREEDLERLQKLQAPISDLLEGQQRLDRKIDGLEQSVGETNRIIKGFQDQWETARIKELSSLYEQAGNFQHDREFEKAGEYYRQIVVKGGEDAEVYWRLLLCHYCVEYQKDGNGQLIPIILNPDLTDPSEMSIRTDLKKHARDQYWDYYSSELNRIDRILDKYRQIRHQVQYDVFISVKQNLDGRFTKDSDVATDLYDYLTGKGLRVFNSRRTVIPAGQEYEPYIISALISSRVLIVVGTCAENMNAQWVRNEWSRFQWMQRYEKQHHGKSDRILFCYLAGGMKPGEIPRALNPNMQAVIDGVRAHSVLDESLAFLLPQQESTASAREGNEQRGDNPGKLLIQMIIWLFENKYAQVLEKYNELIEKGLFLDCARIYLYALCAEKKVHDINHLAENAQINLDNEVKFQFALALNTNEEDRMMLDRLLTRNREVRKQQEEEDRKAAERYIRSIKELPDLRRAAVGDAQKDREYYASRMLAALSYERLTPAQKELVKNEKLDWEWIK